MQTLIVALVVSGCTAYAAWTLMPGAARRLLAGSMLKLALRGGLQNGVGSGLTVRLRQAAQATSGCGCDGCDRAPKKPATPGVSTPASTQTITFHPRIRR